MMTNSAILKLPTHSFFNREVCFPKWEQELTIFCDFDGPIVDVSDRYYSTYKLGLMRTISYYKEQAKKLSPKQLSKAQFWQMKQDRIDDVEITKISGLQGQQIDFFLEQVQKIVNHPMLLEQDKIQPGVNWALGMLHLKGVQLVLVTLRSTSQVENILEKQNIKHLFSGIYGRKDCESAYQNKAALKTELLKKASTDFGDRTSAYTIGDTEADILAAKKLGIPAIALTCGIRSYKYLKQFQPDYFYANLLSSVRHLLKQKV